MIRLTTVLAAAALAAALVLVYQHRPRLLPGIATVAAGVELAISLGLIHLSLGRLPLGLILGGTLAALGAVIYFRVLAKTPVTAATVLAFVGAIQVLQAL